MLEDEGSIADDRATAFDVEISGNFVERASATGDAVDKPGIMLLGGIAGVNALLSAAALLMLDELCGPTFDGSSVSMFGVLSEGKAPAFASFRVRAAVSASILCRASSVFARRRSASVDLFGCSCAIWSSVLRRPSLPKATELIVLD